MSAPRTPLAWHDRTSEMRHDDACVRGFAGEYRWLSNFHPTRVEFDGLAFRSAEAAYQAAKFLPADRYQFVSLSAHDSKKLARSLTAGRTTEEKAAWDARKADVMRRVVLAKFQQSGELCGLLLLTRARYLEETNWWGDVFYGVCHGKGMNMLGIILMEVRGILGGPGVVPPPAPPQLDLAM